MTATKRKPRTGKAEGGGGALLRSLAGGLESPAPWGAAQDALDRGRFTAYSLRNVALILLQRPDATDVAGFVAWRARGRCVRKGEHGLVITAPLASRGAGAVAPEGGPDDADSEAESVRRFRPTYVFDVTQTDPLPRGAEVDDDDQDDDRAAAGDVRAR